MSGRLVYVTIKSGKKATAKRERGTGNGNCNGNLQLQLQLRIIPATTDDLMTKPEHGLTDWMTSTVARRTRAKSQQQQQWGKAAEGGVGNSRSSWSRRATGSCKKLQLKISRRQAKNRRRRSRNRRGRKRSQEAPRMLTKKAATAVNYFEYFSPTPHAVHALLQCTLQWRDWRQPRRQTDRSIERHLTGCSHTKTTKSSNNNNKRI